MPGGYLWGWNGAAWKKVIVDDAGHFQIDVLSSVLPAGAASLGAQNVANDLLSLIFAKLGAGLPLALDALSLKVEVQSWPGDPSTGGRQDVQTDLLSLIRILLNARLPSALDTDALKVREQNWPATYPLSDAQVASLRSETFGGNVYSKTMTMSDDNATRFETTAKLLRDVVIIVKTNAMLLGETGVEVYPVGANETVGFTKVEISTLYFKNAGAGDNGVIIILGVEV